MMNLDSFNVFNTRYTERFDDGSWQKKFHSGDTARVVYSPAFDSLVAVDSVLLIIRSNPDVAEPVDYLPSAGWHIASLTQDSGTAKVLIVDTSHIDGSIPRLTVSYLTHLSNSSNKIYLDSSRLFGHRTNCNCSIQSLASSDSVEIDFEGCGDSTLLRYMATGSPFEIESIVPNPASNSIEVRLRVAAVGDLHAAYSLFDALGVEKLRGITEASDLPLDVSSLAAGTYYLRISLGTGEARTIKIVKE